jgi:hypothetical protein
MCQVVEADSTRRASSEERVTLLIRRKGVTLLGWDKQF